MADRISIDAEVVRSRIEALFAAYPDLATDEELRADMVEGSTDFHTLMGRLVRARQERVVFAASIGEYIADLTARKERMLRNGDGLKSLMLQMLEAAKLPKVELPEATVSITKGRASVDIQSVDDLPQGYFDTVRQPDKAAIRKAIEKGDFIPGARLLQGDQTVTIRTV